MQYAPIITATPFGSLDFSAPVAVLTVLGIGVAIRARLFLVTRRDPAQIGFRSRHFRMIALELTKDWRNRKTPSP